MVQQLLETPRKRHHPNLILHCGANLAERRDVEKVKTPRSTETWTPIPHIQLITQVERTITANNLTVGSFAHSLSHDGARYFGLMEIQNGDSHDDYCWVMGLRNSHDKTFPAGVVAGASIFVCDNLSFSGEVKLARKHTRFIVRDLPHLVESGLDILGGSPSIPLRWLSIRIYWDGSPLWRIDATLRHPCKHDAPLHRRQKRIFRYI